MKKYRRRKRKNADRNSVRQDIIGLLFLVVIFVCVIGILYGNASKEKEALADEGKIEKTSPPEALFVSEPTPAVTEAVPTPNPEDEIYTFLQGPKSWNSRLEWSGEWGESYVDGGYFGGFGCGLCCMANIYSSLTPYQCSPVDMYHYAKKHTYYEGGMAIEWGYMRQSLTSLGVSCRVRKKPDSYQTFREEITDAEGAIVLVSSSDSDVYWKDTPGHYVTVFLYDEENDTVFLADSGNPEHNRQRISLRKVYRSLKTSSNWQYLRVERYREEKDSWKHKKVNGNWVK